MILDEFGNPIRRISSALEEAIEAITLDAFTAKVPQLFGDPFGPRLYDADGNVISNPVKIGGKRIRITIKRL